MTLMSVSRKDRQDYNKLKEELVETCSMQHIWAGDVFWKLEWKRGMTFPQTKRKPHCLAKRFIGREMVEEAVDALVMDKLIKIMPPGAAT